MQKNRRSRRNMGMDCLTIGFAIYHVTERDLQNKPLKMNFFKYNASVARSPAFINLREVRTHSNSWLPGFHCILFIHINHLHILFENTGQLPLQIATWTLSYRSVHIRTKRRGWIFDSGLLRTQKPYGVCKLLLIFDLKFTSPIREEWRNDRSNAIEYVIFWLIRWLMNRIK